jgi:diamine N-acetyltransferase
MIVVREPEIEDVQGLRFVAISSFTDAFEIHNTPENMKAYLEEAYNLEVLTKEFDEKGSKIFLACEDEKIIGFVRLRESNEVKEILGDSTVELQRLYVLTEAHGKSIGKLLMESAMRYATEKNYEWIWLGVWERNFKAQEFYKKLGFEKFSEHTFWMGTDPQIDWLLKKKL